VTTLTAFARLTAVKTGRAQPAATVLHRHLTPRPLVFVPLALAGEAGAPLAALVGDDPARPRLLVVPQPRNRDLRFGFVAELAGCLLPYLEGFGGETELIEPKNGDPWQRALDAPQLVVPNPGGAGFLRMLGRATRFRSTEGPYAVPPSVPGCGRWLTFLADRAEYPGTSLVLPMTTVLREHWVTGQSDLEDANLAALLGWIDPPPGMSGAEAALDAEDTLRFPPAGPATDPRFDNEVLLPAVTVYDQATTDAARHLAAGRIAAALMTQVEPTWRLVWRGVELLRGLPEAAGVQRRWTDDRGAYTAFLGKGPTADDHPQPRRDDAVRAAVRLNRLERAQDAYDIERAYDDPLIMAGHRLEGLAFGGVVSEAEPDRVAVSGKGRKVRRPTLTVLTSDPVRLRAGDKVHLVEGRKVAAELLRITETEPVLPLDRRTDPGGTGDEALAGWRIMLEITAGMGTPNKPQPLPEPGDAVCFTTLKNDFQQPPAFPAREDTPWTHGGGTVGAPEEDAPDHDDIRESWT
jgi:hypothetical protein